MWHEARRQEKLLRGLLVNYRKRSDRRREYYEKVRLDPISFLRIHGSSAKIHLDRAIAAAAEGPQSIIPWQGSTDVKIDRFDARAHLEYIPLASSGKVTADVEVEERRANYERYRILVQNDCAGLTESECLKQIAVDEQFSDLKSSRKPDKKKDPKAAIGFQYDENNPSRGRGKKKFEEEEEEVDEDDFEDLDITFDIENLTKEERDQLNLVAQQYGMQDYDFLSALDLDRKEREELRRQKAIESEKSQFSGRASRRERRAFKERLLMEKDFSPPRFSQSVEEPRDRESSSSRSVSPVDNGPQFITSFGDSDGEPAPVQGPALPPGGLPPRSRKDANGSRSRDRRRRSDSSSRSRSRSYSRSRRRSRSHSRSRMRRSRSRDRRRSRSPRRRGNTPPRGFRRGWVGQASRKYSPPRRPIRRRCSSLSKSKSRTRSRSRSMKRRRSSGSSSSAERQKKSPPRPVEIKRYRRPELESDKDSDDDDKPEVTKKPLVGTPALPAAGDRDSGSRIAPGGSASKAAPGGGAGGRAKTAADRMKMRMQKMLSRQYKADKRARVEKQEKDELEQLEREEDLRSLSLELRRRDRQRRHQERGGGGAGGRRDSRSPSSSPSRHDARRSSSRSSRSRSPSSSSSTSSSSPGAKTAASRLVDY